MGIRVHKQIGYGIVDLKLGEDSKTPNDPRWDYESYRENWQDNPDERRLPDFMAWLQVPENVARVKYLNKMEGWGYGTEIVLAGCRDILERDKGSCWYFPSSAMTWEDEFGLPEVVVFTPPEASSPWSRYDNTLDYYEETDRGGSINRVQILRNCTGIHPWDGFMRRFREPSESLRKKIREHEQLLRALSRHSCKNVPEDPVDIVHLGGGEYNAFVGRWDPDRLRPRITDEELLQHFLNDWRPRVPTGIIAVMEYLDCFPDPESPESMLNSLRPMIYVYWG